VYVACGENHTVAITKGKRNLYSWGCSKYNKFGIENNLQGCYNIPTALDVYNEENRLLKFDMVACGEHFTIALSKEGEVYGAG